MPLNLITDAWIPVRTTDDERRVIRPDQIAEPGVARPDWPRADFNLACYELLIGLVFLADPPKHAGDWSSRRTPDPKRLRTRLAPLAPAFELGGDGPRFLQDFDELEADASPVDMLFIDSSGGNTARNNADLMVKRDRYAGLPAPLAAMALFTLQAQAPSGGAGNRTSMRGGGPLVTLVEPAGEAPAPLWEMVWANVPDGRALPPDRLGEALPWMRPTETSEKGTAPKQPPDDDGLALAEAFFGMPRRLRLDFAEGDPRVVTGVRQRPYGTNYGLWRHPLSPYYQQKAGAELLPMHPRTGIASYRNWAGIAFQRPDGLRHVASTVAAWHGRNPQGAKASLHIGGWAMDNMKPRDFIWSRQPLFALDGDGEGAAIALIEAANAFSLALAGAMQTLTGAASMDASAVEPVREAFYTDTQADFERMLGRLTRQESLAAMAADWVSTLRKAALGLFDPRAVPGLADRRIEDAQAIVNARGQLLSAFAGWGPKTGQAAYTALGLDLPKKRRKKEEETA
ncbi:type I-E CRISPR-associated protein Cse1/CasA [Aquibium sp. A9E412]|uniref:type I-E CRISPR-associated protein Cse1/CasA n=1 Tax=Aquibium sp. A9E412 TaxID=2976767 RepID=UPI0025B23B53|nr:type I-E CRISPR-associated protein Cse1/CasA [Aquibium sp. A9E412]MDN2565201.1 type I-E CRISPR-associated protein Cse1/CasA [Aquibium sp. A9E412]